MKQETSSCFIDTFIAHIKLIQHAHDAAVSLLLVVPASACILFLLGWVVQR